LPIIYSFDEAIKDNKKIEYTKGAKKLLDYVSRTQILKSDEKGVSGGIAGSSPINGCYEKNKILSWATKFYIDALLLIKNE
jgi:hypothetical protein